ncbi:MAG: nicotinate (nicotinamide) nucleotide adenylyltransferase, partial [Eubacterium sp.]|nr:nicotinate (nicotinamide) nucleotide adenylyltransferase [Eubacterium sp.]
MRIGIFGGAFNPVHNGHINLAQSYLKSLSLDKLLIIPTANPPHKTSVGLASEEDRLNMLSLAFKDMDKVELSDVEFQREEKSYTYDTIKELRKIYPADKFFLIIGEDQFLSFDKWYRYKDLLSEVVLCTAAREENKREEMIAFAETLLKGNQNYFLADFEPVVVSSSEIREKIKNSDDISSLVPADVCKYMKDKG